MARRDEIVAWADEFLDLASYPDYGPMGLQVVGAPDVYKLVCSVSASRELFERAAEAEAQMVLVHHGEVIADRPPVLRLGHVAAQAFGRDSFGAKRCRGGFAFFRIARTDHDDDAKFAEFARRLQSEAAIGPGDEW